MSLPAWPRPRPPAPVEDPIETADRELADEIAKAARKAGVLLPLPTSPAVSRLPSDRMTRPAARVTR